MNWVGNPSSSFPISGVVKSSSRTLALDSNPGSTREGESGVDVGGSSSWFDRDDKEGGEMDGDCELRLRLSDRDGVVLLVCEKSSGLRFRVTRT